MHVLFVHSNFPAQFGRIARRLANTPGWRCTYISQTEPGRVKNVEKIQFKAKIGATKNTHFCSRTFENQVWVMDEVYKRLCQLPDIRPDLIVGHSGFGGTLLLRDLYPSAAIVNFLEYYYNSENPAYDLHLRADLFGPANTQNRQRSRCRNAVALLHLADGEAAYTPTEYQRSTFPVSLRSNLEVIFDGVDRVDFHGHGEALRVPPASRGPRKLCGVTVPAGTRVVTYVSRGMEATRGFDIFMRTAKRISEEYPDVLFFVVGTERVAYGNDDEFAQKNGFATFKQWVLAQQSYDESKVVFTGRLGTSALAELLASTDLHIYLTVPFVLSWSMMDAMSCGAVVLGSATPPVKEMIRDGENGLLADFFDIDGIAAKAVRVLKDPAEFRPLGRAAEQMIEQKYGLDVTLPKMQSLYERAVARRAVGRDEIVSGD